jgi:hypothetical protein
MGLLRIGFWGNESSGREPEQEFAWRRDRVYAPLGWRALQPFHGEFEKPLMWLEMAGRRITSEPSGRIIVEREQPFSLPPLILQ